MQPLSIPKWKWDNISMDFVTILAKTSKGSDTIWFMVDKMTKLAHFIPIKTSYPLQKLDEIYIERSISLHCIHSSIISY